MFLSFKSSDYKWCKSCPVFRIWYNLSPVLGKKLVKGRNQNVRISDALKSVPFPNCSVFGIRPKLGHFCPNFGAVRKRDTFVPFLDARTKLDCFGEKGVIIFYIKQSSFLTGQKCPDFGQMLKTELFGNGPLFGMSEIGTS